MSISSLVKGTSAPATIVHNCAKHGVAAEAAKWAKDGRDGKEFRGWLDGTLAWVTMLEALPNGNVIIGNCHAGPSNPQLIEVTRDKKVVWTFKDFKNFGNDLCASQVLDVPGKVIR